MYLLSIYYQAVYFEPIIKEEHASIYTGLCKGWFTG